MMSTKGKRSVPLRRVVAVTASASVALFAALLFAACSSSSTAGAGVRTCVADADCDSGVCVDGECAAVTPPDASDAAEVGEGDDPSTADATDAVDDRDGEDAGGGFDVRIDDFGEACGRDEDCVSGYCIPRDDGRVCTELCAGACPEGWECKLIENDRDDLVRICWPVDDTLCDPCEVDDDCGGLSDLCLELDDGMGCGRDCALDGRCPDGYQCDLVLNDGLTFEQCVPTDRLCAGCIDNDDDGFGEGDECLGPDCDDLNPLVFAGAFEVCDRFDNDCDGEVDEGFADDDTPDVFGADLNCDFVDGVVERSVFVSAGTGDDGSDGLTPDAPVRTLTAALRVASDTGRTDILMAGGLYEGTYTLLDGVGLYGGYATDFTTRSPETVTEIRGNPAVTASSITRETPLQLLTIRSQGSAAQEADGRGADAVAVALFASPGVLVEACTIVAGPGGSGTNGAAGGVGAAGANGNPGHAACEGGAESSGNCKNNCPGGNRVPPFGGAGGGSACGAPGGVGGSGQFKDRGGPGAAGAGPGAGGGGAGSDNDDRPGLPGGPGAGGAAGAHGAGGSGGALGGPGVFWQGANGGTGAPGAHGGGGGGGGAGAGTDICAGLFCGTYCESGGAGGGGGGGGGCGGSPGTGGTAGGASIAVYAVDTSPRILVSTITSGDGGRGGNGGDGAAGGAGGAGGPGGVTGSEYHGGADASAGGAGGHGGSGGAGGAGGGGAGGPSFGILIRGGDDANVDTTTRGRITPGTAGPGGSGGNGGAAGNNGAPGEAAAIATR